MLPKVPGFRFSAVPAGIRKDGRVDVALAVADRPVAVAGVFTQNVVRAAPVNVAANRVLSGKAQAVLVNSGCANACTGEAGLVSVLESTASVARALKIAPELVVPASTGVIGELLSASAIAQHAEQLVARLSDAHSGDFATAIMTTDRWEKTASSLLEVNGTEVRVVGIGKGAGMIHPDLGPPQATLLAFLFTDVVVDPGDLQRALTLAVDDSFNTCSVDGDTSTNDTVLALASGASGVRLETSALSRALGEVCDALARSMVRDGEGTRHTVELMVRGLSTHQDARRIAQTVATSLLVKTALFGQDANWGRILAAAGRAGVRFDPNRAAIRVGSVEIVRGGVTLGKGREQEANVRMREPAFTIELELGDGSGSARYLMSDLGHDYVTLNAAYRS